jgi:hypothetical protein
MQNLITRKPTRLFAFGCSFTKYFWTTWPELVAASIDVPFYNLGKSGAGNQYMANLLMQMHKRFKITRDDMVIVSWTNVCREDRYAYGNWLLTGNIYSQGIYDEKFVEKFADPIGYYVRDLATMNFVKIFLENIGCQYHFLSMCNILDRQDQGESYNIIDEKYVGTYNYLKEIYKDVTDSILPSFYEILWQDNIHKNKFNIERQTLGDLFLDGHPNPIEHWRYLKSVFDYDWPTSVEEKVLEAQTNYEQIIRDLSAKYKKPWAIYDRPRDVLEDFRIKTQIKESIEVRTI